MKRMLITGGTGFIGSNLCNLFKDKYEVTSFSDEKRLSPLFDRSIKNILDTTSNYNKLYKRVGESDIVIHCAGITGIDNVLKQPYHTLTSNIQGVINVLDAIFGNDISHCIIFSSGESLGTNTKIREGFAQYPLYDDRWCYGISKLVAEYLSISRYKTAPQYCPITVVRPFNIYGPGQVGGGAIKIFVIQALKNETITVHGDGYQVRSWCYIEDFCNAIKLIIDNTDKSIGKIYNIGNDKNELSILGLAVLIKHLLNSKSDIEFVKAPFVDVEYRVPDISEISKLGFYNGTDIKEGILKTAEYFKDKL